MYSVYVLYSMKVGKYYTGYTKDKKKRLTHHNLGLNKWSKRAIPWQLVYWEDNLTKSQAIKRERFLKSGKGRELLKAEIAKVVTARV